MFLKTNWRFSILIASIFFVLQPDTIYPDSSITLKYMFYNPVNINTPNHKEIKRRLSRIGFSDTRINAIITYLDQKGENKIEAFNDFVRDNILSLKEANILSHFFILTDQADDRLFDSDFENQHDRSEDRSVDTDLRINLNRFKKEQLLSLQFISVNQADSILKHRRETGRYTSIYQILLVPNIDRITFLRLKPFLSPLKEDRIKLNNSVEFRYRYSYKPLNPDTKKSNYFFTRLSLTLDRGIQLKMAGIKSESQSGYYPGSVLSSDQTSYQFYRLFSLGLYVERKEIGVSMLALGDYSLRFGQHLVFGTPYSQFLYKIDRSPIKKRDQGIRPYSNPNRTGALRGIAFTYPTGLFEITPFVFFNEYELNTTRFSQAGVNVSLESLISNSSVIADDKRLSDKLVESGMGFNVTMRADENWKLGMNFVYSSFSNRINPKINKSGDENLFRGSELIVSSFYFDGKIDSDYNIYGEGAISSYKDSAVTQNTIRDFGVVLGGIFHFSPITYSFLIRYLGDQFNSPHASPVIDERRNEMGLFQGGRLRVFPGFQLTLYFDLFKPLEKKAFSKELGFKATYQASSDLLVLYLLTITYKPFFDTYRTRRRNQGNIEYWFAKDFSFRVRYENVFSKRANGNQGFFGNLFYTQIKYRFLGFLSAIIRVTVYEVEDFDAAVFALENQLPYWYNGVASFSDSGVKYNFMLKSRLKRLWFGLKFTLDDREDKRKRERKISEKLFLQAIYRW